jgi:hypothetical protein
MIGPTVRHHTWRTPAMPPFATDPNIGCKPENAHLFHPANGERGVAQKRREQKARAICQPCPRRADCAAFGLAHPDLGGVWGGLSEHDRGIRPRPRRATNKEAAA